MEDYQDPFQDGWTNERWENRGFIVRGNQGSIYRVTDRSGVFAGDYAFKRAIRPDEPDRFLTEMRALCRWEPQPHVAAAIDHSSLDGGNGEMFFVMPLARGKTLTAAENQVSFKDNPVATARFVAVMADTLAFVHAHDVVHRDIKPWNVVVQGPEDPFIVDFGTGLLRVEYRNGKAVEVAPPRYNALDVYGLGKLIYYMLTGGAFVTTVHGIDAAFTEAFVRDDVSALLYRHLSRMLCHPRERYQTMTEVAAAMREVVAAART